MSKYILSFCLLLLIAGCYKEKDYDPSTTNPDLLIQRIEMVKDTLLANGSDATEVTVTLPIDIKEDQSTIKIKTSSGTFKESGKNEADAASQIVVINGVASRTAVITLQSGLSAGAGNIEVAVSNVKKTKNFVSIRNYAEAIKVIPEVFYMKSSYKSELIIKTSLSALAGKATSGQLVDVQLLNESNQPVGSFRVYENKSNSEGECNFVYTLIPDTTYSGTLSLVASANVQGKVIKDSTKIYVVKK
jgi:hypothetical protein